MSAEVGMRAGLLFGSSPRSPSGTQTTLPSYPLTLYSAMGLPDDHSGSGAQGQRAATDVRERDQPGVLVVVRAELRFIHHHGVPGVPEHGADLRLSRIVLVDEDQVGGAEGEHAAMLMRDWRFV